MLIVTGAAGFIGSCMIKKLNNEQFDDILAVDDFSRKEKNKNLLNKKYRGRLERDKLFNWLPDNAKSVSGIIHLGARTDTTEQNWQIFEELNIDYSKALWNFCTQHQLPFIYASSAATYGDGKFGFVDSHEIVGQLKPLNPYGKSKNDFDKWALQEAANSKQPPFWAGLKFFNVYGPNEYHKGRMASVVFHTFNKVKAEGKMRLFKSYKPEYADGDQLRDFIYVKDVVDICWYMLNAQPSNGLYNVGTGIARSFKDLATNTFNAMNRVPQIEYIEIPEDIRNFYQYFTEAKTKKLVTSGYNFHLNTLEDGIYDYVTNYLNLNAYW